ncbi:hypothetical protein V5O48_019624, partial [Marasmius crinis-equi]
YDYTNKDNRNLQPTLSPLFSRFTMAKRQRTGSSRGQSGLSNGVDFYTAVDDDYVEKETMTGGTADERWNEAKARLRSTYVAIADAIPNMVIPAKWLTFLTGMTSRFGGDYYIWYCIGNCH